jgi:excisionase family DNA binding protein
MTRDVEFTFEEAVRTMGVTPERLERLIDEGRVEAIRGVRTRLSRESVLAYMNKVGQEATAERANRAKPASQRQPRA